MLITVSYWIIPTVPYYAGSYKLNLIRNDRFLKRFGKRLLGAIRQPLLRRNRSNVTLLDSEIDSNLSLAVTPKRTFSLLSQRTLLSKKNNLDEENFYMEDLKLTNGMLSEEHEANGDDTLFHGEEMAIINLEKENGEFGFNIVGGTDQEYIPGDPGIFISRIRNGGSASRDSRLKIGDRIVSVNGILLTGRTHDDAVEILHNTKGTAVLMIEQNAESRVLNKPTELSGILSSNESISSLKSEQRTLSSNQRTSMSSKSMNPYMSQIMPESTEVEKKKSTLSSANEANNDYVDGERMMKNETENQNEVRRTEHERMLEVGSVTTASPLTSLNDETAKTIDERSGEAASLNNGDNHGDNDDDYEDGENGLTSCDHSSSVIDDIPVTPKRPYRLLDPSNPSIFNEVLAVSVGVAALGAGIYVIYKFVKHRSAP
ncbi:hypothetical protein LOAG_04994 [Loa loa]|uniref:PDZ domain-containing protein n=1 Tax=Loa loa TaxID=7209 RepID=A0A1S0U163_LOALO|nr:hypothetical protein LOAG_04994 [Loa loa]EFO23489.2 hypothetical protein LOAG_04994 [Loa loa]